MDRKEVERKIAEHLVAIRNLYHEYNREGRYLSMTIWYDGHNGNDKGNWTTWDADASNAYFKEDNKRPIYLNTWKDVKDEQYWKCVTPEEDEQEEEYIREHEAERIMEDGTYISHMKVDPVKEDEE